MWAAPVVLVVSGAAAAGPPRPAAITKPHLHGTFVDLTAVTAAWTEAQWVADIQAMATVGMSFFAIHHTATGDGNVSDACPAGVYSTYFPMEGPCFQPTASGSAAEGGTVGVVLRAAAKVGLRVHLGLAEQEKLGAVVDGVRQNPLYGKYANATALQQFRAVQSTLAKALWTEHGPSKIVAGFYTFLEEPQVLPPLTPPDPSPFGVPRS